MCGEPCESVGAFEGWYYAFCFGEELEDVEYCFVVGGDVLGTAGVFQVCVFGSYAGVVEACGDAFCFVDLAVFVLEDVGLCAVEHADGTFYEGCAVFVGVEPFACSFYAD